MEELASTGLWKLVDVTPWMLPKHPENGIREYRFETYRKPTARRRTTKKLCDARPRTVVCSPRQSVLSIPHP
jgi:hypothetical protein